MSRREDSQRPAGVAYGTCWCGCGAATTRAEQNRSSIGLAKGDPYRYLKGHGTRLPWKVDVTPGPLDTPCHIWAGSKYASGYGKTFLNGRATQTHVAAWERKNGPKPDGMQLDHLCRVRACCNPDHLEPVTAAENVRRGANTKLTRETVDAIRADRRLQREIAAEYGISRPHVAHIKSGRVWSDESPNTRRAD